MDGVSLPSLQLFFAIIHQVLLGSILSFSQKPKIDPYYSEVAFIRNETIKSI